MEPVVILSLSLIVVLLALLLETTVANAQTVPVSLRLVRFVIRFAIVAMIIGLAYYVAVLFGLRRLS